MIVYMAFIVVHVSDMSIFIVTDESITATSVSTRDSRCLKGRFNLSFNRDKDFHKFDTCFIVDIGKIMKNTQIQGFPVNSLFIRL